MSSIVKDADRLEKLWEDYKKAPTKEIKDELIVGYAPLVKYIAGRMNVYLANNVEYDDLVSYGVFGLIDAVDKYKLTKNVKFETYASLRIRGAILDNIRKMDWIPRTLRQKQKMLDKALSELEAELGRFPTEEEIAKKLDIKIDEVNKLVQETTVSSVISLDDYTDQNYESNILEVKEENISASPEKQVEKEEVKKLLKEAMEDLNEREKKLVFLYYFEELTLKEISKVLDVSESRISQLHSNILLKLRRKLGKYQSILFD